LSIRSVSSATRTKSRIRNQKSACASGWPRARSIRGYVPQKYALFPDKTVLDNITFGPEVSEFSILTRLTMRYFRRRREFRREALQYLSRLGLHPPTRPSTPTSFPAACSSASPSRTPS